MVITNSLDEIDLITALLHDVHKTHEAVLDVRALHLTTAKVAERVRKEGVSFLTKTLPRLGKALDRVLASNNEALKASDHNLESCDDAAFPKFLGELFGLVLDKDGKVLPEPCVRSIKSLRQVLYLFYKYELPYTPDQELRVVSSFEKTEGDLCSITAELRDMRLQWLQFPTPGRRRKPLTRMEVAREARRLLSGVFSNFDYREIVPRHGPGAVATKQRLWAKYQWSNICGRITDVYPLDAYFHASVGHVCDNYKSLNEISDMDLPAKVILVPKDSRGPRLISCEPVDFQWVQQGLGRAIVEHVESIELTKFNVFFTNQQPNRFGALLGSETGRYATLDLNEASDRVSVELVKLLFPEHISDVLLACRSRSTTLPDGRVLELNKFAPMGSALCFPILALTVWAILAAAAFDTDTRQGILVYGDDVIVPEAFALNAIEQLESFGLKVNRDKSCISGLFRESCGMDAYKGVPVTPVRLRTVWSSHPTASCYASWIAYANSFYDSKFFTTYDLIVSRLEALYGPIPSDCMHLACPSIREATELTKKIKKRRNKHLQKMQYYVRCLSSPPIHKEINGWSMLLRYFTEGAKAVSPLGPKSSAVIEGSKPFSASSYTPRDTSMLVSRWQ